MAHSLTQIKQQASFSASGAVEVDPSLMERLATQLQEVAAVLQPKKPLLVTLSPLTENALENVLEDPYMDTTDFASATESDADAGRSLKKI